MLHWQEATVPEEDEQLFPDPLDFHKFSVEETSDTSEQVAEETPNKDDHHDLALAHVTSELNELNGLIEQEQADVSVDTPFVRWTFPRKTTVRRLFGGCV